ncbi:sugar phosphate nucleotidyltransferase [Nocardia aurea]|uniref:sugar phosphate nucleotidyltransferase n=1 Tax=Nocardia aurea TaxID=2144174 RepID=UPI000D688A36|nr:sugar phosphate nucleotidyltransferase [Nocardia aurea]
MSALSAVPQVVVIAGGMGSRLQPVTADLPKILVPVAGRPFLEYVLKLLLGQGIKRIHFCLGYCARQILDYLNRYETNGFEFTSTVESTPLGTGGALRMALPWLEKEFVVLLGDTYTPIDFSELVSRFRTSGRSGAMVVLRDHSWLVPSNVRIAKGLVVEYSKLCAEGRFDYVDYGIAILGRETLLRLRSDIVCDLKILFDSLIAEDELAALDVSQRFYEIGSPAGLAELDRLVQAGLITSFPGNMR